MKRALFFTSAILLSSLAGAPATAQTDLAISATRQWLGDRGHFTSNYVVANTGAADAAGAIMVEVMLPPRQKTIYAETNPCAPYDCTTAQAAKERAGAWACEPPYDKSPGHGPGAAWTRPNLVKCTFAPATPAALAPGERTKLLHILMEGGYPRETCASIVSPADSATANNRTCYSYPATDYDLKLGFSPSTGMEAGVGRWHAWRVFIANKGPTALPPQDGAGGFKYTATLPEKLILQELQIYGGWTCGVAEMNIGPVSVPMHGKVEIRSPKAAVPVGGATLECTYSTPYEFGAGAELATDIHAAGPVYITRGWPSDVATHCGKLVSLNTNFPEKAEKMGDNALCWDIAANKSVPPQ